VARLQLAAFRSYDHLRIEADGRPKVLIGPNGAGKSNLLEALSYLSPGRGLRGARLAEVLHQPRGADLKTPSPQWAVAASLRGPLGPIEIGSGWSRPENIEGPVAERRQVRIDSRTSSQAALAEQVAMVWLTPAMDGLFTDQRAARRRFLDRLVFGLDPAHAGRVQAYDKARRERIRLLRLGQADGGWLAALERSMAERAVAIAAARIDVVERLDSALAEGVGPFPRAALKLSGLVERLVERMPALEAEEHYRALLQASRPEDSLRESSEGPHRSDLLVAMRENGMAAERGSTGEQKALLLALILAEARLIRALRGCTPVLLLDEVAAHLDPARRHALYDEVLALGAQAWMTGVEREPFRALVGAAQIFAVRDAELHEEKA
jgi:DNA replication and repair protein RecF